MGDKAVTLPIRWWVVDWGGVRGDLPDTWVNDNLYPGELRSRWFNLQNVDVRWDGKLTFYYSLGDQDASWIIKPG